MSKTCGIELKGNAAILVVLEGKPDDFKVIPTEFKKIKIEDSTNQEDIKSFSKGIHSFFEANKFDRIGIKGRATKGKFAGGSVSFKMEALIQNTDFPVSVIGGPTLRSKLKNQEVEFEGVNNYQIEAMKIAYCLMLEKAS